MYKGNHYREFYYKDPLLFLLITYSNSKTMKHICIFALKLHDFLWLLHSFAQNVIFSESKFYPTFLFNFLFNQKDRI